MHDPLNQNFVQQGWQCPICKKVYAPSTHMCFYCPPKEQTWTSNNTTSNAPDIPLVNNTCKEGDQT